MLGPGGSEAAAKKGLPRDVLAQKSHKWVQMQNKRYSEKRKAGFIQVGKQVGYSAYESEALLTR